MENVDINKANQCNIEDISDSLSDYLKANWPDCDYSNDFVFRDDKLLMYLGNDSKVVVPEGIKSLDFCCFFPNYKPSDFDIHDLEFEENDLNETLEEVVLPNSLENIEAYCFNKLESLKSIVIPDNVNTISNYAFADCKNLNTVHFGEGLKTIKEGAFSGCSLKEVHLPVGCVVEDGAFEKDVKILRDVKFKQEVDSSLERKQNIKKKNSI